LELTDEDVRRYEDLQKYNREYVHGMIAVEAGRVTHVLPDESEQWEYKSDDNVGVASNDDLLKLATWKDEMERLMQNELNLDDDLHHRDILQDEGSVLLIDELKKSERLHASGEKSEGKDVPVDTSFLNEEQRRAFDIVDWHLRRTLAGEQPPQLRMVIPGEGGTGKSKTIQTITQNFERLHVANILVKGAYTGIAASIIDGRTLHVLTAMPLKGTRSAKTMKKLSEYWSDKKYFVIDEMSMLSRQFLAKLSKIISTVLCAGERGDENLPFGGLNMILVGDFHQFPPVVSGHAAPLYYPSNAHLDNTDAIVGREIYEQFLTVVRLRRQIRVEDPVWEDLLRHVRYGCCKEDHIKLLRSLIITNPSTAKLNYDEEPWKSAVVVTPRHGVRKLWNTAAITKDCMSNKKSLLISSAIDTIEGQPLTLAERFAVLTKSGQKKDGGEERAGLTKNIELMIGMPVMVTWNVHTELDVANGSRGIVMGIGLHPEEGRLENDVCVWKLTHPPSYVLVKLLRTKIGQLQGLPPQVIPITPITKKFNITIGGSSMVVSRTQLPITAAYAFTDYRAQGQTIAPVIVDIGRPPTGTITPFNVYVALSRAKGRDSIRLLRDFDERLLQQHPNEHLRVEDERLKKLDEETERWWKVIEEICDAK
jgi:hypothetical protein